VIWRWLGCSSSGKGFCDMEVAGVLIIKDV